MNELEVSPLVYGHRADGPPDSMLYDSVPEIHSSNEINSDRLHSVAVDVVPNF